MATQVDSGPPASARPTGTVTFLFSDIEGSTSRWDADREAMGAALQRHDAVVGAALRARGAYVFKQMGDSFCAAFPAAHDAVAAAISAQRALAEENFSDVGGLHVRIALHTGTSEERDGDYFGPTVNRVARLLAVAHGDQVILSGATAELAQGELPPGSGLRDLGLHRLKDLSQPERIYQLRGPGLRDEFPPLRSVDELPNNLPRQLTTFVGRDDVMSEVGDLLESHPLVTLVGTGGAGKTRCAVQLAAELLDGQKDGVWIADLASVSDPTVVPNVVAQALGITEQPNRAIFESLLAYLKRKRLLLILDNCEHVIEQARHVAAAVLRECPDVRILATSREPLNIAGEASYRMPSLAVPSDASALVAQGAERYGAVQLFVDRALLSDRRFSFTAENAPHVAEICRRLDGIPLAIELAAARIKVLSPQQLAQRLDERFRVLTGGDRSALPRQQTMRALIDWSYDLLAEEERRLFRQTSIFAGGFTLESAAAVCADDDVDEFGVLDLLSSLVDKSLVQAEPTERGTRYRLLESTRQYAADKAAEAGERAPLARAHARAFLALAQRLDALWDTTPDRAWLAEIEPEMENFRAAIVWSLGSRGDVELGQRLVAALRRAWSWLAPVEGQRWLVVAQASREERTPEELRAAIDLVEALLAVRLTQANATRAAAERALAFYERSSDTMCAAESRRLLGVSLSMVGVVDEAESLLAQALDEARALGAQRLAALALCDLAFLHQQRGDGAGATSLYAEAKAAFRAAGAERSVAMVALNQAEIAFIAGDNSEAVRLAQDGIVASTALNDLHLLVTAHVNLAAYQLARAHYDEAKTAGRKALAVTRETESNVACAFAVQHLGAVSALSTDAGDDARARAARLLGYVDARLAALGAVREYTERREYDAALDALRGAFGEEQLGTLMLEGSAWTEERAVAEAMAV
jgi:predicted ATPase/class 3 adenylate cyclase